MQEKAITLNIDEIVYLVDLIDTCVEEEIDFPQEIYDVKEKMEQAIEELK